MGNAQWADSWQRYRDWTQAWFALDCVYFSMPSYSSLWRMRAIVKIAYFHIWIQENVALPVITFPAFYFLWINSFLPLTGLDWVRRNLAEKVIARFRHQNLSASHFPLPGFYLHPCLKARYMVESKCADHFIDYRNPSNFSSLVL